MTEIVNIEMIINLFQSSDSRKEHCLNKWQENECKMKGTNLLV